MNKCRDCAFWTKESKKWGTCSKALQGTLFMNHTKHGNYMAKHTNARYHGQKACKTRFIPRKENEMSAKTFCPIMMIGFNAPEKGKRDMRLCTKDCAWYDIKQEKCKVTIAAETLENMEAVLNDISDYAADALSYGGYIDDRDAFDPYAEEADYSKGFRDYP